VERQAQREQRDRERLIEHQRAHGKPSDSPIGGFAEPVTSEDVQSLAARGYHFCLEGIGESDVWLVPALTDRDRIELTFRDAATIANMLAAFPGSRVVKLKPKAEK